ncbi:kinesin-like protein KIF22 isoform X2 [Dendrobates tinctorius]|uniref:kinesin-like protein KIF22 isoform X2 n=1 Tax=Dendrobates tinctorius TaxID=92724 RepID=UPI003CC9F396
MTSGLRFTPLVRHRNSASRDALRGFLLVLTMEAAKYEKEVPFSDSGIPPPPPHQRGQGITKCSHNVRLLQSGINMAKRVSVLDSHGVNKKPSPSRVRVSVRLRPYMEKAEDRACVRGLDAQSLEIVNYRNQLETMQYQFDAFYGEKATQREIYTGSVCPILPHLLVGQNASVFAYGPTGAGKTHTMLGSPQQPGIIPRAVRDLLQMTRGTNGTAEEENWSFSITMSYVEIYQEKVMDLLEPKNKDLPIREDKDHNILIPGVTHKNITTFSDFDEHFIPASQNRTVASTKLNDHSSRSHAVLLIKVQKNQQIPPFRQLTGKLYLIDLAGSEDNRRTGNQGIRLKESGAINSSLFTLSKVVDALNQGLPRVPYRDSKLTRLLQDSLGGSAHSVMITNIAPEKQYYFDTLTALNFAAKSKQIINKPFSLETTQAPVQPTKKRSRDDLENLVPSQNLKKVKSESTEESPNLSREANKKQLHIANLDPAVVDRLLKLDRILTEKGKMETQLLSTPKRERMALLKKWEESQMEIERLKEKQKELEEKALAAEARLEKSNSSDIELSDSIVSESTFRVPLRTRATSTAKAKKVLCVKPLQGLNKNTIEVGIPVVEKKTQKAHDGHENKPSWEMNMRTDVLQNGREKILNLLNTGSVKELKSLQKIGDKKAKLIVGWREVNGPFTNVEDLASMEGMSTKQVASFLKANILSIAAS